MNQYERDDAQKSKAAASRWRNVDEEAGNDVKMGDVDGAPMADEDDDDDDGGDGVVDLDNIDGVPMIDSSDEETPLLHSRGHTRPQFDGATDPLYNLSEMLLEDRSQSDRRLWMKNFLLMVALCVVAAAGWGFAYHLGLWEPKPDETGDGSGNEEDIHKGAQITGYASAALMLCARLPQIYRNWRNQSCEGM